MVAPAHFGTGIGALAIAVALLTALPQAHAAAEPDVLQRAINYIFTGRLDPQNGPKIVDRDTCTVLVPDPANQRTIRYRFGRVNTDRLLVEKIYAGRLPNYRLSIEGDEDVIEFLNPDMSVAHAHRTAQIPLPGEIGAIERALKLVADRCKSPGPKLPF